jgi:hypothetical protein
MRNFWSSECITVDSWKFTNMWLETRFARVSRQASPIVFS